MDRPTSIYEVYELPFVAFNIIILAIFYKFPKHRVVNCILLHSHLSRWASKMLWNVLQLLERRKDLSWILVLGKGSIHGSIRDVEAFFPCVWLDPYPIKYLLDGLFAMFTMISGITRGTKCSSSFTICYAILGIWSSFLCYSAQTAGVAVLIRTSLPC